MRTFGSLNKEEQAIYKDKLFSVIKDDLKYLEDNNIIKSTQTGELRNKNAPDFLKESHKKLQKRYKSLGITHKFSGSMKKLEELLTIRRNKNNKPLSIKINGLDVLMSISPLIMLINIDGEETNLLIDKLIEEELSSPPSNI